MVKEITWTLTASKTYWEIIAYLSAEFGDPVVSDFVTRVNNKIELIASNPYLFRKSLFAKNVFITVIHKRVTLVYRYRPVLKKIELLVSRNTRKNPSTLRYR
jgi:plasmid stabilization system protein ParE